jgi:hypothetical protein
MLKRLTEQQKEPVSKRTRSNHPVLAKPLEDKRKNDTFWISATEFDNFCKGDKFSDWMDVLKKSYLLEDSDYPFYIQQLFAQGVSYEEKVISEIRSRTGLPLEKQSSLKTSRDYLKPNQLPYDMMDMEKTKDSMKRGDPIIYSAFMQDEDKGLRGIPDLLVRNDCITTLFPNLIQPQDDGIFSHFGNYYYLPVEIKFSSLHLTSNGVSMLNKNRTKIYKVQLYTYCKILEKIQGVFPKKAFIIGKRTVWNDNVYDSIDQPGIVDYEHHYDSDIPKLFREGYLWLKDVKEHAHNWSIHTHPFLYPNIKAEHPLYQSVKKQIVEEIGEITELWQCSIKHRNNAFSKGIYSWKDERLTSSILDIYQSYQPVVDQLIKTNRGELGDYYPLTFTKNTCCFKESGNEMFVDFETVSKRLNIDDDIDHTESFIFLIGVRYKDEYTSFLMKELTKEEEKRVMTEFYQFWLLKEKPKLWYWYAEDIFWKQAVKRNELSEMSDMGWYDLYEVYQKEPFTVKGCKNFKLKSYITNLKKLGKIEVELPPSSCDNGLDAMIIAWKYYMTGENSDTFGEMIKYNQLDCQYLQVLLDFARNLQ